MSEYDQVIPVIDQPIKRVTRKNQAQNSPLNEWEWPGNPTQRPTNEMSKYDQEIPVSDQTIKWLSFTMKYQSKTNQWNE